MSGTSHTPAWAGCRDGDLFDCDDLYTHDCYNKTILYHCCETCTSTTTVTTTTTTVYPPPLNTGTPPPLNTGSSPPLNTGTTPPLHTGSSPPPDTNDCEADFLKVDECNFLVNDGYHCYNRTVWEVCCVTCDQYFTDIPGCPFGDRIATCDFEECSLRGDSYRRNACCLTCLPPHMSTRGVSPSDQTTSQPAGTTAASTETPAWVIPVACVGGVLLVVIVILAYLLWRRRQRKPESRSPFTPMEDRMYNDYKMSKRPPVAPPRTSDMERDFTKDRKMSAEYAYINPDDVTTNPGTGSRSLNPRQGTDPLPQPPGEYMELSPAEYSYADHTHDATTTSYAERLHDDKAANGIDGGAISNPGYNTKPPETI